MGFLGSNSALLGNIVTNLPADNMWITGPAIEFRRIIMTALKKGRAETPAPGGPRSVSGWDTQRCTQGTLNPRHRLFFFFVCLLPGGEYLGEDDAIS